MLCLFREHYYSEAEGIIFVIDSAEAVRICVVKDELDTLLAHKGQHNTTAETTEGKEQHRGREVLTRDNALLCWCADIAKRNIPILFFANKMDLPKALTPAQLSEALELSKLSDRPWNIVASNALTGAGLETGVKWLTTHLTP